MKRMTLKELQQVELKILIEFDRVCRENDIWYSLGYGSMIGAVRHGGFIPWDDDIDVIMLRKEYERFKELINKNGCLIGKKYKVLLPGDKNYPYPFTKIIDTDTVLYEKNTVRDELGVWIDVFPIDYCAQNRKEALRIAKSQLRLTKNYARSRCRLKNDTLFNMLKNIFWLPFFRAFTKTFRNKILENERTFARNVKMNYMAMLTLSTSVKNIYRSEYFDEYAETLFENHEFMIFKRYDDILTQRYGDYMQIPPESERIVHDPEAYLKIE